MYDKFLMGSGTSKLIIHKSYVNEYNFITRKPSGINGLYWLDLFLCHVGANLNQNYQLPELNIMAHISVPYPITTKKYNYNVIFGKDLLQELGIRN